jgi:16S rRNA pseudouridine516 synthase
MLNKPAGVVSATNDNVSKTVLDLIQDKQGKDLFPVGRLDKDTEGLLIITNDGDLAHQLLSPKKHVDKVYYAKVQGKVTDEDKEAFLSGVKIEEDCLTLPAKLNILKSEEISEIELTIQEGKFHQVKRMFEAVGKEVLQT